MKYLTKQWYKDMHETDMYLPLKVSKEAETFSEEYYNDLYKQEENKWLKLQKQISNVKFEEVYSQYAGNSVLNEHEFKEIEKMLVEFNKRTSFDLEQEKKKFNKLHKNNIENLKYKLPNEILDNVADIRVLALARTSVIVKEQITNYCMKKNRIVEKVLDDYREYYNRELKEYEDNIVEELSLHDCLITNIIKKKDRLTIELDSSGGFTDIKAVIFEDYEIIEEEMDFTNRWWLYEEIYINDNSYEIHSLIDVPIDNKCCQNLGYFTVKAKRIALNKI